MNQKFFGRWEIDGQWIETRLPDGTPYYHDSKLLQSDPEFRREMFEKIAAREGITARDLADFSQALQSLSPDAPPLEEELAAQLGLTDDDLKREKGEA